MLSAFRHGPSALLTLSGALCLALAGCQRAPDIKAAAQAGTASSTPASSGASLGIRPDGDTESTIDMAQIQNEDLKKVFTYIDSHVDEHVGNLQKWIQQPSISNSGEGIPGIGRDGQGVLRQLGCQESRVYDVGQTEWGSQGNPVVYAKCDEGRREDPGHLLDVRHDAGHAAGCVDCAAVRGAPRRAGAVQEGADRPRRRPTPRDRRWSSGMR